MKPKLPADSPRYRAGQFKLPEGSGVITAMVTETGQLEIFTANGIYRVMTPAEIDPEDTNPDAMWVTSKISEIGSENIVVARVYLQSIDILKRAILSDHIDQSAVANLLKNCRESLVRCFEVSSQLTTELQAGNSCSCVAS